MSLPVDYDLAENVYDATRETAFRIDGTNTVGVIVVVHDGSIVVDLFDDPDHSRNVDRAEHYAAIMKLTIAFDCYIIGK